MNIPQIDVKKVLEFVAQNENSRAPVVSIQPGYYAVVLANPDSLSIAVCEIKSLIIQQKEQ